MKILDKNAPSEIISTHSARLRTYIELCFAPHEKVTEWPYYPLVRFFFQEFLGTSSPYTPMKRHEKNQSTIQTDSTILRHA